MAVFGASVGSATGVTGFVSSIPRLNTDISNVGRDSATDKRVRRSMSGIRAGVGVGDAGSSGSRTGVGATMTEFGCDRPSLRTTFDAIAGGSTISCLTFTGVTSRRPGLRTCGAAALARVDSKIARLRTEGTAGADFFAAGIPVPPSRGTLRHRLDQQPLRSVGSNSLSSRKLSRTD